MLSEGLPFVSRIMVQQQKYNIGAYLMNGVSMCGRKLCEQTCAAIIIILILPDKGESCIKVMQNS